MNKTSWGKVAKWYEKIVGDSGHYYHENVILPNIRKILTIKPNEHVLDLGCGQGVYERTIPKDVYYTGIDISPELIQQAKKSSLSKIHDFFVADITKPLPVPVGSIDHAISILALQNTSSAETAIKNAAQTLKEGGDLTFVLNHPCFRIPRQSSWGTDLQSKLEYRRVNRYLSPLEIPINAHPGDKNSPLTWSYHEPLNYYFHALKDSGLSVIDLQEWTSDKESKGSASKMENRARSEFPLFLAIKAVKL